MEVTSSDSNKNTKRTFIKLSSSDEKEFTVDRNVAELSITIKNMLDDMETTSSDVAIPLPNVNGKTLEKVITYMKYRKEHPYNISEDKKDEKRTDDIDTWDIEYAKVDQQFLFELILAANYLGKF